MPLPRSYFDYGIFQCIQISATAALDHGDDFIVQQAKIYQDRRDALLQGLERAGWGRTIRNKATMFSWQPLPNHDVYGKMPSVDFCLKLAKETGVSFAPGGGFGEDAEGFVRMALVDTSERIAEACDRIGAFLKA